MTRVSCPLELSLKISLKQHKQFQIKIRRWVREGHGKVTYFFCGMSNVRFGRRPIIAHRGSRAKTSKRTTHSLGSSSGTAVLLDHPRKIPAAPTHFDHLCVPDLRQWKWLSHFVDFPPSFYLTGPYLAVCVGLKNRQGMKKQRVVSFGLFWRSIWRKSHFKQRAHGKVDTPRRYRWMKAIALDRYRQDLQKTI